MAVVPDLPTPGTSLRADGAAHMTEYFSVCTHRIQAWMRAYGHATATGRQLPFTGWLAGGHLLGFPHLPGAPSNPLLPRRWEGTGTA